MKNYLKPVSITVLLLFITSKSFAEATNSIQVSKNKRSGSFFAGAEVASLSSPGNSLFGYGMQAGYQHVLSSRFAINASFSQIWGALDGKLTALYSGLTASLRYAPFAEFPQERNEIYFQGKRIFEEVIINKNVWSVGIQLNQLLLNGTSSVYPASGLGLAVSYDVKLFGYQMRPELRYGMLTANNQDLSAIFVNLLMVF